MRRNSARRIWRCCRKRKTSVKQRKAASWQRNTAQRNYHCAEKCSVSSYLSSVSLSFYSSLEAGINVSSIEKCLLSTERRLLSCMRRETASCTTKHIQLAGQKCIRETMPAIPEADTEENTVPDPSTRSLQKYLYRRQYLTHRNTNIDTLPKMRHRESQCSHTYFEEAWRSSLNCYPENAVEGYIFVVRNILPWRAIMMPTFSPWRGLLLQWWHITSCIWLLSAEYRGCVHFAFCVILVLLWPLPEAFACVPEALHSSVPDVTFPNTLVMPWKKMLTLFIIPGPLSVCICLSWRGLACWCL